MEERKFGTEELYFKQSKSYKKFTILFILGLTLSILDIFGIIFILYIIFMETDFTFDWEYGDFEFSTTTLNFSDYLLLLALLVVALIFLISITARFSVSRYDLYIK